MNIKMIFLLCLTNNIFAQVKSVTYYNPTNSYYDTMKRKYDNVQPTINEITINPNYTFECWSRPDYSCGSWQRYKGEWYIKNKILYLNHEYEVFESDTRLHFKYDTISVFRIKVRTDRTDSLNNKSIKITYFYDYESHIKSFEDSFLLSSNNTIEIPYENIPNINQLASIRVEYTLKPSERRIGYIQENSTINHKVGTIPNIIDFEIIEVPKKEKVTVLIKATLVNETLEIISFEQTISSIPNRWNDIKFNKYYKEEK